jgi:hypothetical protein
MVNLPEKAQFALVGIIFQPSHEEKWTIQDNRKALKHEFACRTKDEVLDKIAQILDEMDQSSVRRRPST